MSQGGRWFRVHTRSAQLNRILQRIVVSIGVFAAVQLVGTLGFLVVGAGHASVSDAFYMTLITITTVGYGEIVPLHGFGARLFAGAVALVGFGIITFLFTTLAVFFLESDLDLTLRRRRMEKRIRALRGHYIVCGFGRVGRNVATELMQTGREFVGIDHNEAQLEGAREHFPDLLYLRGDASDDDLLQAADIADAAGVFAVTGDDSLNLMITITAKQLNPKVRVVARCHEVRNVEKLRKAGADSVVSPDFTGGKRIASMMLRPHVVTFLDEMLRSEQKLRVEEVRVGETFTPRRLADLTLTHPEFILIAIRIDKDWIFNPQPELSLQPGQTVIAMATPKGRGVLENMLRA